MSIATPERGVAATGCSAVSPAKAEPLLLAGGGEGVEHLVDSRGGAGFRIAVVSSPFAGAEVAS